MKNQNFNIGDKLLCKSELKVSIGDFKSNKYYVIVDINIHKDYYVFFEDDIYDDYTYFFICDNNIKYGFWYKSFFYDYFYTKNEIRELKLKKLKHER